MARYGATLSLTPDAHQALSLTEMRELGRRAVDLHCRVGIGQSRGRWTIRVQSWAQLPSPTYGPRYRVDRHHQRGHLADLIHSALDEYERRYVWTAEELVQIARQSA